MNDFFEKVEAELARANEKHPPMAGIVEGLKTLQCEVAEFDREVFRETIDPAAMEAELIQVGAMCLKFYKAFCAVQLIEVLIPCEDCSGDGFVQILGEKCDCNECEGTGTITDYTNEEVFEIPPGTLVVEIIEEDHAGIIGAELFVKPFAQNAFEIIEEQGTTRKLLLKGNCKPINDPWELFDK